MREKARVRERGPRPIDLHRDRGDEIRDELGASGTPGVVGEFHAGLQFGDGDRGDHRVIVIPNDVAESAAPALAGNEHAGVDDQSSDHESS